MIYLSIFRWQFWKLCKFVCGRNLEKAGVCQQFFADITQTFLTQFAASFSISIFPPFALKSISSMLSFNADSKFTVICSLVHPVTGYLLYFPNTYFYVGIWDPTHLHCRRHDVLTVNKPFKNILFITLIHVRKTAYGLLWIQTNDHTLDFPGVSPSRASEVYHLHHSKKNYIWYRSIAQKSHTRNHVPRTKQALL